VQHAVVLEHVNRSGHAERCHQQKTGDQNQNLALGESKHLVPYIANEKPARRGTGRVFPKVTLRAIGTLLTAFTPKECANYFVNAGNASSETIIL
jgi:hypothetical protein